MNENNREDRYKLPISEIKEEHVTTDHVDIKRKIENIMNKSTNIILTKQMKWINFLQNINYYNEHNIK